MSGGNDPKIANLVPSDIEFSNNYLCKPLSWNPTDPSWDGITRTVKNLFELKNAQRVLVSGNVMEDFGYPARLVTLCCSLPGINAEPPRGQRCRM